MEEILREYVEGRTVLELGAGNLRDARALLELGARSVHCLDKSPVPDSDRDALGRDPRLSWQRGYFEEHLYLAPRYDVLFISYPIMRPLGLAYMVAPREDQVVVYRGQNLEGTVCGSRAFWQVLSTREVLKASRVGLESLIVYGSRRDVDRDILLEERGGLDRSKIYSLSKASGLLATRS